MSTKFETEWTIGDFAHIDGDTSIRVVIVGFAIRYARDLVDCEWFNSGKIEHAEIEPFRLSKAEASK